MSGWDSTMPLDFQDGLGVDEGDLDPIVKNLNFIKTTMVDGRVPTQAFATASLTVTTAEQDVAGTLVGFNTLSANTKVKLRGLFEVRLTVVGTGYVHCRIAVDGFSQPREVFFVAQSAETRLTMDLELNVTMAAAGAHSAVLRSLKDAAGGTAFIVGSSIGASFLEYTVYEQ